MADQLRGDRGDQADLFAVVIVRKGGNDADAKRSRPSSLLFISDGATARCKVEASWT